MTDLQNEPMPPHNTMVRLTSRSVILLVTFSLSLAVAGCSRCGAPEASDRMESAVPLFLPVGEVELAERRSLLAIRAAGVLRMIVRRQQLETHPGEWGDGPRAVQQARALANALGLTPQLIIAPDEPAALDALSAGRGDLIVPDTGFAVDDGKALLLSAPEFTVDAVVVVAADRKPVPSALDRLAGLRLGLLPGSDFVAELAERDAASVSRLTLVPLEEVHSPEALLVAVGVGKVDAAIVYRDALDAYLAVQNDVRPAFHFREDVPARWALPGGAEDLLEAVNGHVFAHAMTRHKREAYPGSLAAIKKRGVLRVGMLNNAASYFIYRGQEVGFQYELAELLASRLAVRLEAVVPERPEAMADLLKEGRADLIPLSAEPGLVEKGRVTTAAISYADHLLVQNADAEPITAVQQLRGKTVHVRASSSYLPRLRELTGSVAELEVVMASEDLETEDLIGMVGRGEVELTVANSVLLGVELTFRDDVQGTLLLAERRPLVYAVRDDAPALLEKLDKLIARELDGSALARIRKRYFEDDKKMAALRAEAVDASGAISPYDELVRTYARRYGLDWRLLLAQMYQESRFDPNARSWVGAMGLLQIMPRTGAELGFTELNDPETNIHAGAKYMAHLIARFDPALPMRQRVRFALASYNAGYSHVADARLLARRKGWDPNRWFGNVERAIRLLEEPRYYRRARYGFCRGSEPVAYVSRIQSKYDAYSRLVPPSGPDLSVPGEP